VTDSTPIKPHYVDPNATIVTSANDLFAPPSALLTFLPRTFLSLPLLVPLIGFAVHPNSPIAARAVAITLLTLLAVAASFAFPYREVCPNMAIKLSAYVLSCQVYLAGIVLTVIISLLVLALVGSVVSEGVIGDPDGPGPTRLTEAGEGLNLLMTLAFLVLIAIAVIVAIVTFFSAPKQMIASLWRSLRYAPTFFVLGFVRNKHLGRDVTPDTCVGNVLTWTSGSRPELSDERWLALRSIATPDQKEYLVCFLRLLRQVGDAKTRQVCDDQLATLTYTSG